MEPDIKRINFFDGLFLKEGEFLAEQLYHLHMRRRINYMLFETSGVVQIEAGDLRVTPTSANRFLVTPGMALSHRTDLKEGREVVLTANSAEFDLAALGFSGGDTAIVAIHYEDGLTEPQTGVDPATETRVEEQAVVTVHDAADPWPPATPLPDGEQYIPLGQIDFSTMTVAETATERQTAVVRSALFGGGAPPTSPSISTLAPSSGAQSSTVAVHITGTNLAGASVTASDPAVTVSGVSSTSTTVDFTLTIGSASTFTITVDTGVAPAATETFTIGSAPTVPVIDFLSPAQQASGATVNIHGTDIRDTGLAVGVPATGTTIRLIGGAFTKTVPVGDSEVRPGAGGNQVVRFAVPDRTGTSWGATETVSLELEFDGGTSAAVSFQYDD